MLKWCLGGNITFNRLQSELAFVQSSCSTPQEPSDACKNGVVDKPMDALEIAKPSVSTPNSRGR